MKKMVSKAVLFVLVIFMIVLGASAHETESNHKEEGPGLHERLTTNSIKYILAASVIAITLVAIALLCDEKSEVLKWLLFLGMTIPILFATVYSASSTIYLNTISETGGPVHWHADFEIWHCGEKINIIDPIGLSNRVGNPVLHEHNDFRIHIEGVLVDKNDANLKRFFSVIGSELKNGHLIIPTENKMLEMHDGDKCPDGSDGNLQAYLYKIRNPENRGEWIFDQTKLEDYVNYVPSPYPNVPPGDCIIIEFGPEKEKTENMCESFKTALQRGEFNGS